MSEKYNTTVLREILKAEVKYRDDKRLLALSDSMFRMYTDSGFPPDMFLAEVGKGSELTQPEKIFIISRYQGKFLEHRRKSGIQEKNIDKIRRKNREDMERFIQTGELSIY